ncbi:MAG: DMT family transporter [Candidatus Sumerlaeaceae bacterium]|jgi:probable blue pigment (indigoidine) exporter
MMWRPTGRDRGIVALLAATIFWGTSIVAARVILRDVAPFILSHFGALVSATALLVPLAWFAPQHLRVERRDLWRFAVLGSGAFAVGGILINVGIQRTSAATAATLQYLAPAMTLAYGWLTKTERVDAWKVGAVLLSVGGAAVATGILFGQFVFDTLGILAAIGSAACFSFITIFSKSFASRYNAAAFTGLTFLAMGLAYFVVDPTSTWHFVHMRPLMAVWIAGYAVVLGVLPTILYFYALRWVEATAATIVLSFEIVVTSVLGWLWLGERLALWQVVGAAMVIAAVVIIERRRETPA